MSNNVQFQYNRDEYFYLNTKNEKEILTLNNKILSIFKQLPKELFEFRFNTQSVFQPIKRLVENWFNLVTPKINGNIMSQYFKCNKDEYVEIRYDKYTDKYGTKWKFNDCIELKKGTSEITKWIKKNSLNLTQPLTKPAVWNKNEAIFEFDDRCDFGMDFNNKIENIKSEKTKILKNIKKNIIGIFPYYKQKNKIANIELIFVLKDEKNNYYCIIDTYKKNNIYMIERVRYDINKYIARVYMLAALYLVCTNQYFITRNIQYNKEPNDYGMPVFVTAN